MMTKYPVVHTPDWQRCILKIERHGFTQSQIARRIGVHQSTVCRIKAGNLTPRWDTGEAILMCLGELSES